MYASANVTLEPVTLRVKAVFQDLVKNGRSKTRNPMSAVDCYRGDHITCSQVTKFTMPLQFKLPAWQWVNQQASSKQLRKHCQFQAFA
jgi:hypothetical protein